MATDGDKSAITPIDLTPLAQLSLVRLPARFYLPRGCTGKRKYTRICVVRLVLAVAGALEFLDLLLRLFAGDAVALLYAANQLFALAINDS